MESDHLAHFHSLIDSPSAASILTMTSSLKPTRSGSQRQPQPQLDHIIILIPIAQLRSIPSWLSSSFTITPGGAHADGLTENVLILLSDGVYIELIAFTESASPEGRAGHWWGKLPYGIVDYAFTLPSANDDVDSDFVALREQWEQAGLDAKYTPGELVQGGRRRTDGVQLEWRIAQPNRAKTGIPNFWCVDITPRQLRVPLSPEATKHASGVTGVAEVVVTANKEDAGELRKLFGAYLEQVEEGRWAIGTPVASGDSGAGQGARIRVREGNGKDGDEGIMLRLDTTGRAQTIVGDVGGKAVRFELV